MEVFTWAGKRIARQPLKATIQAGGSQPIGIFDVADLLKGKAEPHEVCLFIRLRGDGVSHENFMTLVPWKWMTLPAPEIKVEMIAGENGVELSVSSKQVIPFFHAELGNLEGHFHGDWQVLRPGSEVSLEWRPHRERGAKMPTLKEAKKGLRVMSLYDTYEHAE